MLSLLLLVACQREPASLGVYRSGPNAIAKGSRAEPVRVWGTGGTQLRVPTAGAAGTVLLGEAGPLWIVDRDVPAPAKAPPVAAAMVESAGFRMKGLLVPADTAPLVAGAAAPDAAKSGGVYVRSVVKVRQDKAPPIYIVTATGDEVGAGAYAGPADVRKGENCKAAVGLLDSKGEVLLSAVLLTGATRTCAVPMVVPPVDRDGDGVLDVLVHGQNGTGGFRSWFRIDGTTLVAGPEDVWETIP
ncbi:MAG: hypothetical protein Q8P18_31070 [Pseudomonadota bacterium]|nr:hypothetical protein [Pseudomonadota bacterium]